MAGPLTIELCSPEHEPVTVDGRQAVVPGSAGIFTVLPNHTPLMTTLTHGVVIIDTDDEKKRFFAVHGGFAEVLENRIDVLADMMETGEHIDLDRAKRAMERAQTRLLRQEDGLDVPRAEAALARAMARLQAHHGQEY